MLHILHLELFFKMILYFRNKNADSIPQLEKFLLIVIMTNVIQIP